MKNKERIEMENKIYEAVFPVLATYETRGFNAHSRSQAIQRHVTEMVENWIKYQHPELTTATEEGK